MTRRCIIWIVFLIRQCTNKWDILEWPPYSPGLNPIENLRAIIKKRLQKQVATWEQLESNAIEIWEEMDAKTVRHISNSFQGRLENVKSNEGAIIGYEQLCVTFRIIDF